MKVALKAYLDDLFEPLLSGAVLLEDYPPNTGLFPFVSNGETQVVEWQVMVNALQEMFAALSHKHAAGDITSGTLGLARGGTGAATAAAARTNLGAGAASGWPRSMPTPRWLRRRRARRLSARLHLQRSLWPKPDASFTLTTVLPPVR